MSYYELTYLLPAEISEEELKAISQRIVNFISETGGIITKAIEPLRKKLAYSIKQTRDAFIISLYFSLEAEKIIVLEKKVKEEERVLRYLILVKKPESLRKKTRPERELSVADKIKTPEKVKEPKKVELKELDKEIEEILKY